MTVNYHESYGAHATSGILFNHASERGGNEFVTRKVTSAVARMQLGLQDTLSLGNLDERRNWGFAGDYVDIGAWSSIVVQDARFLCPAEVDLLLGDASKARDVLGWRPEVTFERLIHRMVDSDLAIERRLLPLGVRGSVRRVGI